jgi:hypothetical protein
MKSPRHAAGFFCTQAPLSLDTPIARQECPSSPEKFQRPVETENVVPALRGWGRNPPVFKGSNAMAADDSDPFEQGKLACFNHEPRKNPYPKDTEQHDRWEQGYDFVARGLVAV